MPADKSRPVLRWLHISDLHYGLEDAGFDRAHARSLFFEDLMRLTGRIGPIDVVLFTGDLTQAGTEQQFEEFDREFVEPLLRALREPKLFAIPGNHDLEWPSRMAETALAKALGTEELRQQL